MSRQPTILSRLRSTRPAMPSAGVLRVELLAGLVVALALIPEAISFSIIAGVDPRVGLYRVVHDGGRRSRSPAAGRR